MHNSNIFIHIPKTGGTTINTAMHNVYWQTDIDFNYRHIDLKTKYSTSGDIFEIANRDKYRDYNIFTMLRDPLDRVISEYYFLRERKEFINLLNKPPQTFRDYYSNPQTHNYMTGFLVGKRIYDKKPTTKEDLERVIDAIDSLPIHVGIFEHFAESLGYFSAVADIQWSKNITAKRMTFNRPKKDELPEEVKAEIRNFNQLDQKLYNYCLDKFSEQKTRYKNYKINVELSKYNHIYPYMAKTCLFEFCLDNKHFIKQNFDFFKKLTFFLIKEKGITDGKQLVISWNRTFIKAIQNAFPSSTFEAELSGAMQKNVEPLQQLIALGETIDNFFKADVKNHKKFYKPIPFSAEDVTIQEPKNKGFFSRIFGK
ncbi:sulfotransferase family protein [Flavobacteriales bacterium]|nr:sulfotransferase family protein [Flavobacteriales bacterium]